MTASRDPDRRIYGRRHGRRLRPGRRRLMQELLPKLRIAIPESGASLELAALFPGATEFWLEIGFGAGEHLATQAGAHPGIGLIGCEPFVNGVAALLGWIDRESLGNIRIHPGDGRDLLDVLPDASIGRVFILFPDPWPKTRHARRRLLGGETLAGLARVMKDGAELRLATDDPGQLRWMLEQMSRAPAFRWTARGPGDWRTRPADWPATRYEEKSASQGRASTFLRYARLARQPYSPAIGQIDPQYGKSTRYTVN